MPIVYALEPDLTAQEFQAVLAASTLAERRPANDLERLDKMLRQADVTACTSWIGGIAAGAAVGHKVGGYIGSLFPNAADAITLVATAVGGVAGGVGDHVVLIRTDDAFNRQVAAQSALHHSAC